MTRALFIAVLGYVVVTGASVGGHAVARADAESVSESRGGPQAPSSAGLTPAGAPEAVLNQYCTTCHNARAKTGGLSLDAISLGPVGADAETWEKVVRKVRAGLMPPAGMPRPPRATLDELAGAIESAIDRAADPATHPGRVPLHRMNRVEYANAIRDLLSLDVDAATLLPADNSSRGFDNIADVLGVSPSLLEGYVSAAAKVSRLAVGDREAAAKQITYPIKGDLSQNQTLEGQPLGTRGGTVITHTFPVDGEYTFRLALKRSTGGVFGGGAVDQQLEVTLNDQVVKRFLLDPVPGSFMRDVPGATPAKPQRADPLDEPVSMNERLEFRLAVRAGPHTVRVAFLQKAYETNEDLVRRPLSTTYNANVGSQYGYSTVPHLAGVTITGPYNMDAAGDTPSRRRIFVCHPNSPVDDVRLASATASSRRSSQAISPREDRCAREIVSTLVQRAFRRRAQDADLDTLLGFFREERERSGSFEAGIELALRRILADPEFIFRFETGAAVRPGAPYRISDTGLASRLSFFLWSSIPDDELLRLAIAGRLHEPAVLEQQTRRMLRDPKARALVTNFAAQWLYLRDLKSARPDEDLFVDFDDNLRQGFQRETELLFDSILRENRSVLDLLDADYTYVNERLAKHYGISNVYGPDFRRVPIPNESRRGLLGQGSLLLVTSSPNRTSPVIRGKWILENLLGSPPPLPPPDVPAFQERPTATAKSVRERIEQHRNSPACAGCHKIMDPIGLALENFDAVGRWRTEDEGVAIDASSQLVDGTLVSGPASLRRALLDRPDAFVGTVTEKLLMYGIGRETTYADMPVVRAIMRDAAPRQYRLSDLILGVVKSVPFQWRVDAVNPGNSRKAE
jgi:cytochrome c551/c552